MSVAELKEQLAFARQKASLYYIVSSELDSLKNSLSNASFVTKISVQTQTNNCSHHAETQTPILSETVFQNVERESLKAEIEQLRNTLNQVERMEAKRIEFVNHNLNSSLAVEYSELFAEYLKSCQLSVNHSVEIRKRDAMIGALLDNIKLMESSFAAKLSQSESVAQSRKDVIEALGEQVKEAVRLGNQERQLAAMQAEMEDLRAELCKARTNWAATREELVRVQFHHSPAETSTPGLISAIRKVL